MVSQTTENKRKESKQEVQTYLDRLKYAIQSNTAKLTFQKYRNIDNNRNSRYTNRYTMGHLFSDEDTSRTG